MTHIENVDNAFQPEVFDAIDRELVDALRPRGGLRRSRSERRRLHAGSGAAGQTTAKVRLHDAYRDPKLTDCGVELSRRAAAALRRRYAKPALVMSSTLQRARARQLKTSTPTPLLKRRRSWPAAPLESGNPARQRAARLEGASLVPAGVARNSSDWGQFLLFFGGDGRAARYNSVGVRGRPAPGKQARWRRRRGCLYSGPRRLPPGGLWIGREAGEQRGAAGGL